MSDWVKVPTALSLAIIAAILALTVTASLLWPRQPASNAAAARHSTNLTGNVSLRAAKKLRLKKKNARGESAPCVLFAGYCVRTKAAGRPLFCFALGMTLHFEIVHA